MNIVFTLTIDIMIVFIAAKLMGAVFKRLGIADVLGELVAGAIIGPYLLHLITPDTLLTVAGQIGAIGLLFLVGLDTHPDELRKVRTQAMMTALLGVVIPFALGFALLAIMRQGYGEASFVGAAMTATSVGVTARVLSDLKLLRRKASRVILAAAVIDDILGIMILAIVSISAGHGIDLASSLIGIAIIGAFSAGVVVAGFGYERQVERWVSPVCWVLTPLFFALMGMHIDVKNLFSVESLGFVTLLTILAIAGKMAGGLGALQNGWPAVVKVGVGMVPRGEIGLIIALIGLTAGIVDARTYSQVVAMVFITTLLAPLLIRWSFGRWHIQDTK